MRIFVLDGSQDVLGSNELFESFFFLNHFDFLFAPPSITLFQLR